MGIILIVFRAGDKFKQKNGKPFYRNKVIDVIGLGDITQYNKKTKKPYVTYNFQNEKQLVKFLYDNKGHGRYVIYGSKNGKFFVFWKGTVDNEGWLFENQNKFKKELAWLDKEIENAEDDDDKSFWEGEKSKEKEELKEKKNRYGFSEMLKSSGRRGVKHYWDEEEYFEKPKKQYDSKGKKKKMEDMSIDELNNF